MSTHTCPNCGHAFSGDKDLFGDKSTMASGRVPYPEDFEEFWSAYPPAKNQSKSDAFKAWKKTYRLRPPQNVLMRCLRAYAVWIATETKRKPKDPPAVCHAATWINGRRWESQMDVADKIEAKKFREPAIPEWGRSMADTIGSQAFATWFKLAEYEPGPPPIVRVGSSLQLNYVTSKYAHILDRCFGAGIRVELRR